jgi:hypothetical protein
MAWERKHYLKKQLFDFDVKGQGPTKVITVCDTPPYIGGVYQENHLPAASLTNFIRNGVSSNKGVLIADIYIRTTVYINLKNIPPREPRGKENTI